MLLARIPQVRVALLACAALLATPGALDAQTSVGPDTPVRNLATSAASSLITGTVIELNPTSLVLAPRVEGGARTGTPREDRLEVRGAAASMTASVLRWVVAGAVVGYAVCHVASGSPHANCPRAAGAAAGATVGLVVGLGLEFSGSFRRAARWRPVPVLARAGP